MKSVKNGKIKWTHKDGGVVYYPIAEATEPLMFIVDNKDISKAKDLRGYADPNCCVAACAVRRQFTDAIFQRDTAYTLQVHKGIVHAVRYRFGYPLRKAIAAFDGNGIFPLGNYKLLPPTPSQTLESKRKRAENPPITKRKLRPHLKFGARGKVSPLS